MDQRIPGARWRQKSTVLPSAPSHPPCIPPLAHYRPTSESWRAVVQASIATIPAPAPRRAA